ncbi:MAG: hypothetical protein QXZ44_02970 [Ferroplasma sp.]
MLPDNNEANESEKDEKINSTQNTENNNIPEKKDKARGKKNAAKYNMSVTQLLEIIILIIGIILIGVASYQSGKIGEVKLNDFTDIAFPLSFIFILSPFALYLERLRSRNIFITIIVLLVVGILLLYYLIFPYRMFVIHMDLLAEVLVEYIIGLLFIFLFLMRFTSINKKS